MLVPRLWTCWFCFGFCSCFFARSAAPPQEAYDDDDDVLVVRDSDEETDPNDEFKNSPMTPAVAVAGAVAVLPCNISSTVRGESVQLVLWYRDNVATPIFSYDARAGAYSRPLEWASPEILGDRAHFSVTTTPSALVLNETRRTDQSVYRCRVDYKHLTTTHARVNLTVIEPVGTVRIVDGGEMELVGVAGPYTVGQRPTLTCIAKGGDPPPTVTWWRDGRLLDSTYHHVDPVSPRRVGREVVNTIHLRALKKEDLHSTYNCQAANDDLAPTKEAAIELDMNFGPESVVMKGLEGPISARTPHPVVCEARGSRPPAILTWWLNGRMKKSISHMTSLDGVLSTSTLEMIVGAEAEGSQLTCRAENPDLPATTIEVSHQLTVLYPPEVRVAAGSSLDLNNIKEGEDVYFDCHIKASPEAHRTTWSFNGVDLQQNVSGGVIVFSKSLVLQKVSRRQAGKYTCSATNTQGSNTSAPIFLSVKYSPVCRVEQTDVYGIGRHEKTTVTCRVEADPPVTSYRWAFNNSGEFVDIPVQSQWSDLRYSPVSDLDYGTLLCWATNAVGVQRTPCTFTVFPAGKPDVVGSCSAFNETEEGVSVSCEPGYSGGVDQSFLLEAWDDGEVRATDTSETPLMQVTGLRQGTRYTLKVFAVNAMGRSQPYVFTAFTLTDVAERRTALGAGRPGEPLSPIVGSVIGGVAAVVLLMATALVVAKCKRHHSHEAHGLREGSTADDVGRRSCGRTEGRQDLTDAAENPGHGGPDLVSASQESAAMAHSHDSSTPLMGNGRVLQGQTKAEQLRPPPPQHRLFSEQQKPQHVVGGGGGGAAEAPYYRQEDLLTEGGAMPFQQQKLAYVPVYDYQRHPQPKGVWCGGVGPPERTMAMTTTMAATAATATTTTTEDLPGGSSPYGSIDPRRHSAYLRPLDQLPPQFGHLQPQLGRQYAAAAPQEPQPHYAAATAAPKVFQPASENESAV